MLTLLVLGASACAAGGTARTQTPASALPTPSAAPAQGVALVIQGGAGTITRASMTPEREREYTAKLTEALQAGHSILQSGGTSMDAVIAAINVMEDSPPVQRRPWRSLHQ